MKRICGFHLTPEDDARLADLASATKRTRSGVIAVLLRQATVAPHLDINVAEVGIDARTPSGDHA